MSEALLKRALATDLLTRVLRSAHVRRWIKLPPNLALEPGSFSLYGHNQDLSLTEAMVEAWSQGGPRPGISAAARGRRPSPGAPVDPFG